MKQQYRYNWRHGYWIGNDGDCWRAGKCIGYRSPVFGFMSTRQMLAVELLGYDAQHMTA